MKSVKDLNPSYTTHSDMSLVNYLTNHFTQGHSPAGERK